MRVNRGVLLVRIVAAAEGARLLKLSLARTVNMDRFLDTCSRQRVAFNGLAKCI